MGGRRQALAPAPAGVMQQQATACPPVACSKPAACPKPTGWDLDGEWGHAAVVERDVPRDKAAHGVDQGRVGDRGGRVGVAKHLGPGACEARGTQGGFV